MRETGAVRMIMLGARLSAAGCAPKASSRVETPKVSPSPLPSTPYGRDGPENSVPPVMLADFWPLPTRGARSTACTACEVLRAVALPLLESSRFIDFVPDRYTFCFGNSADGGLFPLRRAGDWSPSTR